MKIGSLFCYYYDMQDNYKRGARTVFWTKITLSLSVVFIVLFMFLYRMFQTIEANPDLDAGFLTSGSMLLLFIFAGVCLLLGVSYSIQGLFWLLWMFRAEENLRKITHTTFSPWGAVLCCFLPYLGTLLHFFVFRDIIRHTESELSKRRTGDPSTYAPAVPMNLVIAFFVCGILGSVISFIGENRIVFLVSFVIGFAGAVCYLKALGIYIKEEAELYGIYKDCELRNKVDEVLREREIEKAASEIREIKD